MKKYISIVFLVLAILLYFLYTMMDNMLYFAAGTFFATPGVIGLFSKNKSDLKTFTILVFVGSVLNIIATSYGVGGSIVFLVVCGITYSCLKNLKVFFTTSLILGIWLVVFLYYQLLIIGTVNGDIFLDYGLSRNYPGSMLVIFNCLWAVWKYLRYGRLPLFFPILSTVMAFFLDGRSSLICMLLITVFCIIFRGRGRTKYITTFLLAGLTLYFISYFWDLIIADYELTSLATKGFETSRTEIWSSYINHQDFISFLFGLDSDNLPILREVGGNPHNSFLSIHRRMGIIGLITLLYYMFKELIILIRKKQFVILFFNLVLIVRMFVDGMLTTAQDFFILTLFFLPLCYNNKVFRIEEQIQAHGNSWFERLWDKIVFII